MVKIRLRRTGAKKKPSYRLVVADERAPRNGRFIEIIGHYNPRTEPVTVNVHEDRALYWLSEGAQPTDSVKKLLQNLGTLDRFARLKEGADLEQLVAEAQAASQESAESAQPEEKAKQVKSSKTKSVSDDASKVVEETPSQAEAAVEAEAVKDEA